MAWVRILAVQWCDLTTTLLWVKNMARKINAVSCVQNDCVRN